MRGRPNNLQIQLAGQLAGINPATGEMQIIQMWTGFMRHRATIVYTTISATGGTHVYQRPGGQQHLRTAFDKATLGDGFNRVEEPALRERMRQLGAEPGSCTTCSSPLPVAGSWCPRCGTPQQQKIAQV